MRDNETDDSAKLAGCGLTVLVVIALITLGLAAAVIFVLFMFGSWIGGQ